MFGECVLLFLFLSLNCFFKLIQVVFQWISSISYNFRVKCLDCSKTGESGSPCRKVVSREALVDLLYSRIEHTRRSPLLYQYTAGVA